MSSYCVSSTFLNGVTLGFSLTRKSTHNGFIKASNIKSRAECPQPTGSPVFWVPPKNWRMGSSLGRVHHRLIRLDQASTANNGRYPMMKEKPFPYALNHLIAALLLGQIARRYRFHFWSCLWKSYVLHGGRLFVQLRRLFSTWHAAKVDCGPLRQSI